MRDKRRWPGNSLITVELQLIQPAILDRSPPEIDVAVETVNHMQVSIMSEKAFQEMGYVDPRVSGKRILCCDSDGYTVPSYFSPHLVDTTMSKPGTLSV